ncbi:glycosyltransferase involved in cell wall biosynthesis [Microbacterium natoriense]|uniref:D-inositol 3-phosphate glycosyltransferase n=1 Tax=Microbacterium natoriense TaxID=284570 RepID=A0AAW8EY19_9MICO|nr:glycosyltransferase family 4 protein [Microbacterium natoriense]MDQ0647769.1 glycosyltransferase involved in cell wall biosynthesis [Microbacterium natoriense]
MRIVVVNNFFPPRPGGSSHLADNLAREYANAGHEVLVLTATYADAPTHENRDGFEIVRIPAWTLPKTRFAANFDIGFTISPRAKRRVFDILDDFAPDVVHQHGQFFDLTWLSGWWARSRKRPTLLSIHTRLESPLSRFNSFVYSTADRLLVAPLMRLHRPTLVVMDKLMDRYIDKRYSRSISGKVVIPVGIDPEKMQGGDAAVVPAQLETGDRPLIVSLGHVIPQRNRLALIRALPRVLSMHPLAVVVIVGGVYHDEFLTLARELGVEDSVRAVGARPSREIPDYLAAAVVEVHELEGQGFGTASLEALAAGVPVVAGVRADNFISIPLRHGEDLFLVPGRSEGDDRADVGALADMLIGILDDPAAARTSVSANAQSLIDDHFTIRHVAAAHLEALEAMRGDYGREDV